MVVPRSAGFDPTRKCCLSSPVFPQEAASPGGEQVDAHCEGSPLQLLSFSCNLGPMEPLIGRKEVEMMTRDQILAHLRTANAVARDAVTHGHHPFGAVLVGPDDRVLISTSFRPISGSIGPRLHEKESSCKGEPSQ